MDLPYIFKGDGEMGEMILDPDMNLDAFIEQITGKLIEFLQSRFSWLGRCAVLCALEHLRNSFRIWIFVRCSSNFCCIDLGRKYNCQERILTSVLKAEMMKHAIYHI